MSWVFVSVITRQKQNRKKKNQEHNFFEILEAEQKIWGVRDRLSQKSWVEDFSLTWWAGRPTASYWTSPGLGFLIIRSRELKMVTKSMPTLKSTILYFLSFAWFFESISVLMQIFFRGKPQQSLQANISILLPTVIPKKKKRGKSWGQLNKK